MMEAIFNYILSRLVSIPSLIPNLETDNRELSDPVSPPVAAYAAVHSTKPSPSQPEEDSLYYVTIKQQDIRKSTKYFWDLIGKTFTEYDDGSFSSLQYIIDVVTKVDNLRAFYL